MLFIPASPQVFKQVLIQITLTLAVVLLTILIIMITITSTTIRIKILTLPMVPWPKSSSSTLSKYFCSCSVWPVISWKKRNTSKTEIQHFLDSPDHDLWNKFNVISKEIFLTVQNSLHWSLLIFEAQKRLICLRKNEEEKTFKMMPIVFGNVQKGSKCSDVHIVCIREPFEYYFMEFPLPLSRIFFFVEFFHWMGVPLSPHFRACINSYISQVMINLVRCSMSSGQRRQGALLIEVFNEQPDHHHFLGVYLCAAQTPVNLYWQES